MHNGEKSKKCNQCDFASVQKGDLRKHLKTHSGEKPYKCNQCDYASSQAINLRQQIGQNTTHSGYGPKSWKLWLWFDGCECENPEKNTDNVIKSKSKCNQCGSASFHAGHLRQHLKTHNGEKSKKCNQCHFASFYGIKGFEKTFENAQWRKAIQMQPMWFLSSQPGNLSRHLKTHDGI